MHDFDDSLTKAFAAPICPTCATGFNRHQYDDVDESARCSNCGATYRIADDYRPHPRDHLA